VLTSPIKHKQKENGNRKVGFRFFDAQILALIIIALPVIYWRVEITISSVQEALKSCPQVAGVVDDKDALINKDIGSGWRLDEKGMNWANLFLSTRSHSSYKGRLLFLLPSLLQQVNPSSVREEKAL
jgi:hypothetical protein